MRTEMVVSELYLVDRIAPGDRDAAAEVVAVDVAILVDVEAHDAGAFEAELPPLGADVSLRCRSESARRCRRA